ncbi:MAG: hypothetical protein ACYCWE_15785 [Eubacteriales bacterium]
MKKIVCIFCALLMLFVCACSGKNTGVTESTVSEIGAETIAAETAVSLPTEDYGGYSFTALCQYTGWANVTFSVNEETGDIINDAIYQRNIKVEETYNVDILEIITDSYAYGEVAKMTVKSVNAGDDLYDVIFERAVNTKSLITGKYLYNLAEIPWLDFGNSCWNRGSVEDLSLKNKVFLAAGDILLGSFDATWVMFFNKNMIAEMGLDDAYTLVDSNSWTFEKFNEMTAAVVQDVNGDGKFKSADDRFGMYTHTATATALVTGAGESFASKDTEDRPYLTASSQKMSDIFAYILRLWHTGDMMVDQYVKTDGYIEMFYEGRTLFCGEVMSIYSSMRDMEDDWGVLPWPKYDETQENFNTFVNEEAIVMAVPVTAVDVSRTGLLLEALCEGSTDTLRKQYYEVTLQIKAARDERMADMLDIIFDNRSFDLAMVYDFGGILQDFKSLIQRNKDEYASFIAKNESDINKDIDELLASLD